MDEKIIDRAVRFAGETAADMENDVKHVLSKAAIERVVCAVLLAIRNLDEATVEALFQARDGFVDKHDIAPLHRLVIDLALGESNETDDLTKSAVVSQERA